MGLKLDFTNMTAAVVGEEFGVRDEELEALRPRAAEIHRTLMAGREKGFSPFYELPFQAREAETLMRAGDELAGRWETLVVLGIGGSALGSTALMRALCPLHHNLLGPEARGGRPRLFVLDNVDPAGVGETLDLLDPRSTLFLVVSKSGSTVETMAQFLIARAWMEEAVGDSFRDHFLLITDPVSGGLRQLAKQQGYASFAIPEGIGGRFSVFTAVGLLPLAAAGVDIRALLGGAAALEPRVTSGELLENPAYLNAALQFLSYGKGLRISVMMPYSDRLRDVAGWFGQIWAESLGKKHDLGGRAVHVGPTPVSALGTTDQHSQVQLYMEGPFDKVVTFLAPEDYGRNLPIPAYAAAPHLGYLEGQGLEDLIRVEQQATAVALAKNGRPNCTLSIPEVSAEWLGALLYFFEIQTVFAGALFDINPLDQPGVEEGKEFTYALMGRAGFEQKLSEFNSLAQGVNRRILS